MATRGFSGKTFPPVGRCIYCGTTQGKLSREHIIPLALGGNLILPYASCRDCADIIKKFEQLCARNMFGSLRIRLGMPTRRPSERPTELSSVIVRNGVSEVINVPSTKFPAACVGLKLPSPGILLGKEPSSQFDKVELVMKTFGDEYKAFIKPGEGMRLGAMNPYAFCKLLAKIAHSFAVSQIGLDAFTHFLPDVILGKNDKHAYFIGGDEDPDDPPQPLQLPVQLHQLQFRKIDGTQYLFVTIQLFRFIGMPRYHIVVGEDLRK